MSEPCRGPVPFAPTHQHRARLCPLRDHRVPPSDGQADQRGRGAGADRRRGRGHPRLRLHPVSRGGASSDGSGVTRGTGSPAATTRRRASWSAATRAAPPRGPARPLNAGWPAGDRRGRHLLGPRRYGRGPGRALAATAGAGPRPRVRVRGRGGAWRPSTGSGGARGRPVGDDQDVGRLTKIDEYIRGLTVLEMPTAPAVTTAIAS